MNRHMQMYTRTYAVNLTLTTPDAPNHSKTCRNEPRPPLTTADYTRHPGPSETCRSERSPRPPQTTPDHPQTTADHPNKNKQKQTQTTPDHPRRANHPIPSHSTPDRAITCRSEATPDHIKACSKRAQATPDLIARKHNIAWIAYVTYIVCSLIARFSFNMEGGKFRTGRHLPTRDLFFHTA